MLFSTEICDLGKFERCMLTKKFYQQQLQMQLREKKHKFNASKKAQINFVIGT